MYSNSSVKKLLYLCADCIALVISYVILSQFYSYRFLLDIFFVGSSLLIGIILNIWSDNYSSITERNMKKELRYSVIFALEFIITTILVVYLGKFRGNFEIETLGRSYLLAQFLIQSILVFLGRSIIKQMTLNFESESIKTIVMTNFSKSSELQYELSKNNYKVVAFLSQLDVISPVSSAPVLHNFEEVCYLLSHNEIQEVVVSYDAVHDFVEVQDYFVAMGIPVTICMNSVSEDGFGSLTVQNIGPIKAVTTSINTTNYRSLMLKRIVDIIASLVGLVITGIVWVIIYPIVQKQSKGPMIFKQKRVGKNGKVFEIYKFRSMYLDAEERKKELMAQNELTSDHMFKMEHDPRIFPFGQKIRDWSIDELPQFINVLKGDMSLVGTRPPTLDEYHKYELHHFKRLAMKPGITGMWQVSGRSNITDFEQVVALDLEYIKNWSIWLDVKIILKTFKVVLFREGSK